MISQNRIAAKVEKMSRTDLKWLLAREGYGVKRIAQRLALKGHGGVSHWFAGRCASGKIERFVRALAAEVLAKR